MSRSPPHQALSSPQGEPGTQPVTRVLVQRAWKMVSDSQAGSLRLREVSLPGEGSLRDPTHCLGLLLCALSIVQSTCKNPRASCRAEDQHQRASGLPTPASRQSTSGPQLQPAYTRQKAWGLLSVDGLLSMARLERHRLG